uniref:cache domain-containing protein n=1 Tax=Tateyamaria sp. syn59 TaxID=2576942 RepID=UPI001671C222
TIDIDNVEALRPRMKALSRIGGQIIWAGVVDDSGQIVANSLDSLEGVDVGAAKFFRRALSGSYVGLSDGDVISEPLRTMFPEERKFIDMAAPVRGADGSINGVLVYRLGMSWIEGVLTTSANALGIDLYLVEASDRIVAAGEGGASIALSETEKAVVSSGLSRPTRVDLPGGDVSFISVLPPLVEGPFMSLDWKVATRTRTDGRDIFAIGMVEGGAFLFLVSAIALLSLVFARVFLDPMERIASSARKIAADADVYPPEERGSRTSYQLSAALAIIQGKLKDGFDQSPNMTPDELGRSADGR